MQGGHSDVDLLPPTVISSSSSGHMCQHLKKCPQCIQDVVCTHKKKFPPATAVAEALRLSHPPQFKLKLMYITLLCLLQLY